MRNPPKKPRLLALALHAALLALPTVGSLSLLPQAAQAQSAPATYSFDIPAGPLSTALTRIAAHAGVQLTANAELTAGKNAPAIKGGMSLQQALERALAGSGLEAVERGASTYVLRHASAPPSASVATTVSGTETTLPVVMVKASTERETATSHVIGYVAKRSTAGTKTDTPLREIPQSISVVGREQIQDQGARSLQGTLRYEPSVVADLFGLDSRNDGFAIRGQQATVQFLDGMRRFYGNYVNSPPIDPYALERIEILRGPSSLLYGQSGVGGTINMVSKRPRAEFGGEVGLGLGSHDAKELSFDVAGPVTADGRWLYRLVGLVRDADTQVDYVPQDRQFIAPSLTWQPTADTSLTLLTHWSRDRSGTTVQFLPHEGTLFPGPNGRIPINRFVGEPDIDRYDADTWSAALQADHKINETWSLHQGLRYYRSDVTYAQLFPYLPDRDNPFADPERRSVGRDLSFSFNKTRTVTWDTNAVAQFDLGATRHKVLVGLDHSRANHSRVRNRGVTDCNLFDLYDPVYGRFEPCDFNLVPLGEIPFQTRPDRAQRQSGLYVQDQVRLGSWIAVVGLRKDWTENETQGAPAEKARALTRRAGLMYELAFGLTPYVSYAESFVPLAGSDFFDRTFKPLQGKSIEAGFKYQPHGTSLAINSAVFDSTEQNRLAEDPAHPGFSVQSAEVRLRGFEIEARGDLTRNAKLIASYSYLDAKHLAGDNAGFRVESLPEHMASLWAVYTLNEGMLRGFSFGGGVRYKGDSWGGASRDDPVEVSTPGHTLFDAMLAYDTKRWRYSLNVANLADKAHIATCLNRGDCFLGAGRQINARLSYKF